MITGYDVAPKICVADAEYVAVSECVASPDCVAGSGRIAGLDCVAGSECIANLIIGCWKKKGVAKTKMFADKQSASAKKG